LIAISRKSFPWLLKAAQQGLAEAQFVVGGAYYQGHGIPQDYTEAATWIRKSADQGYRYAQHDLGAMYANGRGVKQDYVAAYMWTDLAISKMKESDQNYAAFTNGLESIAKHLTDQQIGIARNLAILWKPWKDDDIFALPSLNAKNDQVSVQAPKASLPQISHQGPPPVIFVNSIPTTNGLTIDLEGKVASVGRITALTVDGTDIPFGIDGTFRIRRGIPIGESEFHITVIDEWGQVGETTLKAARTVSVAAGGIFPPLEPRRLLAKTRPKSIALIIGIGSYETAPLPEFADNDARSFYDYAINALGVPADRIRLLTNSEARQHDIVKALLTWAKPLIVRGQTDVYVYFSGHGLVSADGNDLFLLPYDGDRDLLERSAVRRKELIDTVVDAGAASATFFLDTCYSGATRSGLSLVASARPILLAVKEQQVPPNVTIFAAAGNDQLSSSMTQTRHGLFSYFLMKGLEGDAAGADHTITAAKLEAYLAEHIPPEAAKLGRMQIPQLAGDGSKVISSW